MKTILKLTSVLWIFLIFSFSQKVELYVNNIMVPIETSSGMVFKQTDNIKIVFLKVLSDSQNVSYNILLNGKEVYPENLDNNKAVINLSNLPAENYILKIFRNINNVTDNNPYIMRFQLTEAIIKETSSSSFDTIHIILSLCCIILSVLLIIVFISRKNLRNGEITTKDLEIDELKVVLQKTKENLKTSESSNKLLSGHINELKRTITELENYNDTLLEQKEKLQHKKQELEELQRQKDEVFAMAVHDIKNPVSAIRSLIQLLESYDLTASEQQEIMQTLVDSSENIMKLTKEMTEVISKQKVEKYLEIESASVKEIIDTVVNINATYAKKKGIKIINKSSNAIPEIKIDKLRIQEVIDNLLNNAIKYGPENTIIEIRAFFSETKITIEVADNGVGLSDHDVQLLFSKGVVLSSEPTGGEHRSGLGLWISRRIVEEHGGKIWAKSKLGSGSTFGFELPIKK